MIKNIFSTLRKAVSATPYLICLISLAPPCALHAATLSPVGQVIFTANDISMGLHNHFSRTRLSISDHTPNCPAGGSIAATPCLCRAAWFVVATSLGIPLEVPFSMDRQAVEGHLEERCTVKRQCESITDLRNLLRLGREAPLCFFYPLGGPLCSFPSNYNAFSALHKRYLNSILLGLQYAPQACYKQAMKPHEKHATMYERIYEGMVSYDEVAAHEIVKQDTRLLVRGFIRPMATPEGVEDVVGVIQKHLSRPYSQVMGNIKAYLREREEEIHRQKQLSQMMGNIKAYLMVS